MGKPFAFTKIDVVFCRWKLKDFKQVPRTVWRTCEPKLRALKMNVSSCEKLKRRCVWKPTDFNQSIKRLNHEAYRLMFFLVQMEHLKETVGKAEQEKSRDERDLKDANRELRHLEKLLAGETSIVNSPLFFTSPEKENWWLSRKVVCCGFGSVNLCVIFRSFQF